VCHPFSDTPVASHTSSAFIYCSLPLSTKMTYIHAVPQQHLDTTLTEETQPPRNTTTEKHNPQETQPPRNRLSLEHSCQVRCFLTCCIWCYITGQVLSRACNSCVHIAAHMFNDGCLATRNNGISVSPASLVQGYIKR
jgi:tRNA A37 methylthiotransferase MiaB